MLIRHGESVVTVNGVIGGHETCTGLSSRGRGQAEALRRRLERTQELADADVFLTSILPRAIETAELIAPGVGDGRLTAEQDCDLCEQHPGESDGLTWEEFERTYRPDGWRFDPNQPFAPGAESWVDFTQRVSRKLRRTVEEHEGKTIVVACHGGVIAGALVDFLGIPDHGANIGLQTENTSITEFAKGGDAWPASPDAWRFVRYNDHAHLLGAEADGER